LKDADLGVAMGSGSPVARGVAQLVLLDDQFEALPFVVAEGRQVLHNIERVAALFLVKNVYSFVISVVVAIAGWPYPFLPRHLSLISAVAIGIPGFFLAMAPSQERFQPGFLARVLRFSIPAGVTTAVAVLVTFAAARAESTDPYRARTAAVIVVMIVSLWVLTLAARPLLAWKAALILAMAAIFAASFVVPGVDTFFNLEHRPSAGVLVEAIALGGAASATIWGITYILGRSRRAPA
jgi:cation-transporting ATPase E